METEPKVWTMEYHFDGSPHRAARVVKYTFKTKTAAKNNWFSPAFRLGAGQPHLRRVRLTAPDGTVAADYERIEGRVVPYVRPTF